MQAVTKLSSPLATSGLFKAVTGCCAKGFLSRTKGSSSIGTGYWAYVSSPQSCYQRYPATPVEHHAQNLNTMPPGIVSVRFYSQKPGLKHKRSEGKSDREMEEAAGMKSDEMENAEYIDEIEAESQQLASGWSRRSLEQAGISHEEAVTRSDRAALYTAVKLRSIIDYFTGYQTYQGTTEVWLDRICLHEVITGGPNLPAGLARHFLALCRMRWDGGLADKFLTHAETDRMHLLTCLNLRGASPLVRFGAITAQSIMMSASAVAYAINPQFYHRLVGYIGEDAVLMYTDCLAAMDDGLLQQWNWEPASDLSQSFWSLSDEASLRELIVAIRADETKTRAFHHALASMDKEDYRHYRNSHSKI